VAEKAPAGLRRTVALQVVGLVVRRRRAGTRLRVAWGGCAEPLL